MELEVLVRKGTIYILILLSLVTVPCVRSHGFLYEPANRASLWRFNFKGAPIDYNDNQLFCGGYQKQWVVNGGNCGLCGDDYSLSRPRPYENTGINSRGIISRAYQSGSTITVVAMITASHLGYFEFHLCPLEEASTLETESCFNKYPLPLVDGSGISGYRYYLNTWEPGKYTTKLLLPKGLSCERCVLRWQYIGGNDWGNCQNGTQGLGCGPQETFRTCSDITITPNYPKNTKPQDMLELPDLLKILKPKENEMYINKKNSNDNSLPSLVLRKQAMLNRPRPI